MKNWFQCCRDKLQKASVAHSSLISSRIKNNHSNFELFYGKMYSSLKVQPKLFLLFAYCSKILIKIEGIFLHPDCLHACSMEQCMDGLESSKSWFEVLHRNECRPEFPSARSGWWFVKKQCCLILHCTCFSTILKPKYKFLQAWEPLSTICLHNCINLFSQSLDY